ncbi:hypothetical protein ACVJMY_004848 [Bradyrhizobium diazoefficiens]
MCEMVANIRLWERTQPAALCQEFPKRYKSIGISEDFGLTDKLCDQILSVGEPSPFYNFPNEERSPSHGRGPRFDRSLARAPFPFTKKTVTRTVI